MAETHITVQLDDAGSAVSQHGIDDWLGIIMRDEQEGAVNKLQESMIPKVPRMLSLIESNQGCYEPVMVSIGPYHRGKPQLQEMENFKATMVRQFVRQSGKHILDFYNKVAYVAEDARGYYTEDVMEKFDDKKFTKMMFLDGCFILQFITWLQQGSRNLKMSSYIMALVTRDLFLLENQLPFPVLRSLMRLRFDKEEDEGMELINHFIGQVCAAPSRRETCRERILKFVHKMILPRGPRIRKFSGSEENHPVHLLELLHTEFVGRETPTDGGYWISTNWYRYHPATELISLGVKFTPSQTRDLTQVRFRPTFFGGIMEIPPLTIHEHTKSLLLNLVAYEACHSTASSELPITSYICFMDSLIAQPEDVKELRSQGILFNTLGSDQQVADFFNEIGKHLTPNPHAYAAVKRTIESECQKNAIRKWITEWKRVYFSSPWTFIAVVAATVTIILTAIQTYAAVYPPKDR